MNHNTPRRITAPTLGLLTLLFLVVPTALLLAQNSSTVRRNVLLQYDLDSGTDISCLYNVAQPVPIPVTAAASTTLAATTASTSPYANAAVGDALEVTEPTPSGATTYRRLITARASADSITVDTALTVTGRTFKLFKRTCSSTAGWIPVDSSSTAQLSIAIEQMVVSTGGIAFKIEGYFGYDPDHRTKVNLWPGTSSTTAQCADGTYASGYCVYTAATVLPAFTTTSYLQPQYIRVVMKLTGTDSDATPSTDNEKITIEYAENTHN